MTASAKTFWLEPSARVATGLRRYSGHVESKPATHDYHTAIAWTGLETAEYAENEGNGRVHLEPRPGTPRDDPRWPTRCDECPYEFTDDDNWQDWQEQVYRRTDTGELRVLHQRLAPPEAPAAEPGASWDAWWMPSAARNPDGRYLMVRLPDGHDWSVDSRASNCDRPDDNVHRCWVRSGDPTEARVTAGKEGGDTCGAGAGSIQSASWHGFLRDGMLAP